jgi:hypothetical protein
MPDVPQDEDLPPFGVGWTAGRASDEESLDRKLQREGETSVEAFSCLLVDAAVALELVQAMSRGSELANSILGVLGPYVASIEGMRSRREAIDACAAPAPCSSGGTSRPLSPFCCRSTSRIREPQSSWGFANAARSRRAGRGRAGGPLSSQG